jgi:hypothetical protein
VPLAHLSLVALPVPGVFGGMGKYALLVGINYYNEVRSLLELHLLYL